MSLAWAFAIIVSLAEPAIIFSIPFTISLWPVIIFELSLLSELILTCQESVPFPISNSWVAATLKSSAIEVLKVE